MPSIESILRADERIEQRAKISKRALVVTWLSIPFLFLVSFLGVYLPKLVSAYVSEETIDLLTEAIDAPTSSNPFEVAWEEIFSLFPPVLLGFLWFFVGLLTLCWLCWALYMTRAHFRYALAFTAYDLIGIAKKQILRVPLRTVNNIYVERSLWGKLFGYGTITVASSRGAISVRNVARPKDFARELSKVTVEEENNFLNL